MTAIPIDGKSIACTIRQNLKHSVDQFLHQYHIHPGLAIILIGNAPESKAYIHIKIKRSQEIGIHAELIQFSKDVAESVVIKCIEDLNQRSDIHGIILQLPLPSQHLSAYTLMNYISAEKDVDGVHIRNVGALHSQHPRMIPCTPKGILTLLKSLPISLKGQHAVVIGRSMIVGRPMAALLLNEDCTVTHIHSHSKDWQPLTRLADIVIVAAGVPKLLTVDHIQHGSIIIDVGSTKMISLNGDPIYVGDVDDRVAEKAGYMTPVPGGVGPMTVAMLLQNTLEAAWHQCNKRTGAHS